MAFINRNTDVSVYLNGTVKNIIPFTRNSDPLIGIPLSASTHISVLLNTSYSINNSLVSLVNSIHSINNILSIVTEGTYTLNNTVTNDVNIIYSMNNELKILIDNLYSMNNTLTSEVDNTYSINNTLNDLIDIVYSINNGIEKEIESLYSINNIIQDHTTCQYTINNTVKDMIESLYSINNQLISTVDSVLSINNTIKASKVVDLSTYKLITTTSNTGSLRNNVVMDKNYNLYTAFCNNADIFVYKSVDNGTTWSTLNFPNTSKSEGNCHMVIGTDDKIHIVYRGYTDLYPNRMNIKYVTYDSNGWSNPILLTQGDIYGQDQAYIALDSSNNPIVIWTGFVSSGLDIKIRKYNGSVWLETESISSAISNYPCIAIDSSNCIHAVWSDYSENSIANIHYRKFNGLAWGNEVSLTTGSVYNQYTPDIAIGPSGNIHVVWIGGYNAVFSKQNISYKKCIDGIWNVRSNIKLASNGGYDNYNPRIIVPKEGMEYVVYSAESMSNPGTIQVSYLRHYNNSWTEFSISFSPAFSYYLPSICYEVKDFSLPIVIMQDNLFKVSLYGRWNNPIINSKYTLNNSTKQDVLTTHTVFNILTSIIDSLYSINNFSSLQDVNGMYTINNQVKQNLEVLYDINNLLRIITDGRYSVHNLLIKDIYGNYSINKEALKELLNKVSYKEFNKELSINENLGTISFQEGTNSITIRNS